MNDSIQMVIDIFLRYRCYGPCNNTTHQYQCESNFIPINRYGCDHFICWERSIYFSKICPVYIKSIEIFNCGILL